MKLPIMKERRRWIAIGLACIIVVTGLYIWWSIYSWQAYNTTWHATQTVVKQAVADATKDTPVGETGYIKKHDALRRVVATLATHEDMCQPNVLIGWQQFLHATETSIKDCKELQHKYAQLETALNELVTYVNDEQKLQKELVWLVPSKADVLDEKQWPAFSSAAIEVQSKVNKLQVGEGYTPVLTTSKKQLTTLVTKWKAFNQAHEAHDRIAWEKAKGELVQAYSAITSLADVSEASLQGLLKRLDTAYDIL